MKTPAEFLSKKGLSHRYPIIGGKYDSNLLNLLIEFNEYQGFEQLESRIKELEQTIENMKAIAGEKIEPVGCVSSVDYPSENETEIDSKYKSHYNTTIYSCKSCNTEILRTNENYCPNCGRKILR